MYCSRFQETRFFNAADVTVQGFELEGTGLVTDNFTLSANVSYNDGEYDKFEADTNGDGVNDVFLSGLRYPHTRMEVRRAGCYVRAPWAARFDLYGSVGYEDANVFYYSDVPTGVQLGAGRAHAGRTPASPTQAATARGSCGPTATT